MFSKQKYLFIFPLVLAALYGCGFMPLKNSNIKTNFVITQDLPNSLKVKLLAIQNYEKSGALEVRINDYDFKKYEVYGGIAIRSLEGELKLKVNILISSKNGIIKNKDFLIMRRYKTNELNPFSQNKTVEFLKNQMENDLIDQIMLEVNLIEM